MWTFSHTETTWEVRRARTLRSSPERLRHWDFCRKQATCQQLALGQHSVDLEALPHTWSGWLTEQPWEARHIGISIPSQKMHCLSPYSKSISNGIKFIFQTGSVDRPRPACPAHLSWHSAPYLWACHSELLVGPLCPSTWPCSPSQPPLNIHTLTTSAQLLPYSRARSLWCPFVCLCTK